MNFNEKRTVRIAILDLYDGVENQGMRCIREIVNQFGEYNHLNIISTEFNVRQKLELPGLDHDIYIGTGGPGSPTESEGQEWDNLFMKWIERVNKYNRHFANLQKKHTFFICHSFQLASRHYRVGKLTKRKSTSFGVFPIHLLENGKEESVFDGMSNPFYAVDSRDYQLIQPNHNRIKELGAAILCIEKERLHVPYERAVMALRFDDYSIGTQFHPEADPFGMSLHLQTADKKKTVIANHGQEKWESMIEQLNDPEKISWTYSHILPNFLNLAVNNLHAANVA